MGRGGGPSLSGLLRKINSKGVSKERYVEVDESLLRFYYRRTDSAPQGTIDLLRANFVRPYELGPSCTVFEVQDGLSEKVFAFDCPSPADMQRWIDFLDPIISKASHSRRKTLAAAAAAAAAAASNSEQDSPNASERMALYEAEGLEGFSRLLSDELGPFIPHLEKEIKAVRDSEN